MSTENKYYDLGDDTLNLIQKVIDNMALPFNIKIKYLGTAKQKKLISLNKTKDLTTHLTGIDLVIIINEDYFIKLEEKNAEILIHQELDRLEFDLNKGTFKISKFTLQTTTGVLKKYGIDAVAEANQLSELYTQQKQDSDIEDTEFDISNVKTKSVKKDVEFLN